VRAIIDRYRQGRHDMGSAITRTSAALKVFSYCNSICDDANVERLLNKKEEIDCELI